MRSRAKFNHAFKIQAVEKALNRSTDDRLEDVAGELGVGFSTLQKWLRQARNQEFEMKKIPESAKVEKRPRDWTQEDKLEMVIRCGPLSEAEVSALCREQGVYPHHVAQWKQDFLKGSPPLKASQLEERRVQAENKKLKKELHRKERALAEAAALLVLQKKVNTLWAMDEDDSP